MLLKVGQKITVHSPECEKIHNKVAEVKQVLPEYAGAYRIMAEVDKKPWLLKEGQYNG